MKATLLVIYEIYKPMLQEEHPTGRVKTNGHNRDSLLWLKDRHLPVPRGPNMTGSKKTNDVASETNRACDETNTRRGCENIWQRSNEHLHIGGTNSQQGDNRSTTSRRQPRQLCETHALPTRSYTQSRRTPTSTTNTNDVDRICPHWLPDQRTPLPSTRLNSHPPSSDTHSLGVVKGALPGPEDPPVSASNTHTRCRDRLLRR